ncbi:TraR/DksA C4-type zinc finger protein [Fictibacillus nanhaiensis]|uniref:TraR/DksA C4-type zinc finger protein n=1 Tax=Fictibacillus nanhaiensis TaxID=742169 RepID=UPI001C98925A|nr:TraR/DksA C4-type zinc finger protein [Fictibacillus nanhaiensis]MBY6036531.1 TraR/DksA C4-type zinc finger protein [Fictibacillus nanhaiensis]
MSLTTQEMDHFREILLSRKEEIKAMRERNDSFGNDTGFPKDSTGELSSYDNHPGDLGTELFEKEKDIALNDLHEKELEDIDAALNSMENGDYGVCKTCGADISKERLEAVPATLYCKEHSPGQHSSDDRPIEEEVAGPDYSRRSNDGRDATFFDSEDTWQSVARYGTSETPSDFTDPEKSDYNEMYEDSEDDDGYVEDYEGFVATDITGKEVNVVHNRKHEEYEDELDAEEDRQLDKDKYDN